MKRPQVFVAVAPVQVVGPYGTVPVLQRNKDGRIDLSIIIQIRCMQDNLCETLTIGIKAPNGKSLTLHRFVVAELVTDMTGMRGNRLDEWDWRGACHSNFTDVPVLGPGQYTAWCGTEHNNYLEYAYFLVT